jgi:hypothetical protein
LYAGGSSYPASSPVFNNSDNSSYVNSPADANNTFYYASSPYVNMPAYSPGPYGGVDGPFDGNSPCFTGTGCITSRTCLPADSDDAGAQVLCSFFSADGPGACRARRECAWLPAGLAVTDEPPETQHCLEAAVAVVLAGRAVLQSPAQLCNVTEACSAQCAAATMIAANATQNGEWGRAIRSRQPMSEVHAY